MIHPSYVDLMEVVNKNVEEGETPVINSRYSIVMATAKRARQIVDGDEPLVKVSRGEKPLSIAVDELNQAEIRILAEDEVEEEYIDPAAIEGQEAEAAAETAEAGEASDGTDSIVEPRASAAVETAVGEAFEEETAAEAPAAEETAAEEPAEEDAAVEESSEEEAAE